LTSYTGGKERALLLNLVPAFAPPTFRVFSFLGILFTKLIGWTSAVVGALAATPGRSSFGQDVLQTGAQQVHESNAFTPLSSNFLFIA
jgi:hypothetical protein